MLPGADRVAILQQFRGEIDDRLHALSTAVLGLEEQPGSTTILSDILREAHTLKGSARMLGVVDVHTLAHRMEDFCALVKQGQRTFGSEAADLFLQCIDQMASAMEAAAGGQMPADLSAAAQGLLGRLDEGIGASESAVQPLAQDPPHLPLRNPVPVGDAVPARDAEPVRDAVPAPNLVPVQEPPHGPSGHHPVATDDTLRVATAKLDRLVHVSRQLTTRAKRAEHLSERSLALNRLVRDAAARSRGLGAALGSGAGAEAQAAAAKLERTLATLEEQGAALCRDEEAFARQLHQETLSLAQLVTGTRMVPAAVLFDGMRRTVRDVAQLTEKQIQLVTEGEETELDKRAIDQLQGPLLHLVRNSIDHGIEDREVRVQSGKPPAGRVVLRAALRGSVAAIEVEDDGCGIDPKVMRQVAIEKGILPQEAAARLSDDEALYLAFAPGFTTRRMITELSGRGVGLDAVKASVEKLGGRIVVQTELGHWTRVSLEVPLLLALTRGVVFEVGAQRFALPTACIERVVRPDPAAVHRVGGTPVLLLAGATVPILDAQAVLGQHAVADPAERVLIIVAHLGQRVALPVDALLHEEDLVVAPLGAFIGTLPLAAGAAVRGDGEVVVVLKPGGLLRGTSAVAAPPALREAPVAAGRKLLVVDDAVTVRELMRSLLESQGHSVDTAVDGADGLEKARQTSYDCIVSDVEMPRMTGYELTRALRADAAYARTPIVIVSTRMATADRRQGLEAGASAYFEKGAFDQAVFLETIARLLR